MSNDDHTVARMAGVKNHLAPVVDPEAGPVGHEFYTRYEQTGCTTSIIQAQSDQFYYCLASYIPFIYLRPDGAFVNELIYTEFPGESPAFLTLSFIHEATHAMQWDSAPVLHATPFNTYTPVAICPLDWLVITRISEQDAYVKRAWLASLLGETDPGVAIADEGKPLTGEEFKALRAQCGDLKETFNRAAAQCMEKEYSKDINGNSQSFADYYNGYALNTYGCNQFNRSFPDGPSMPILVRMEDEDLLEIGKTFGLNILEGQSIADLRKAVKASLSGEHLQQLESLNQKLGIGDEDCLPTFRSKLAETGQTPGSFMQASKANNLKPI